MPEHTLQRALRDQFLHAQIFKQSKICSFGVLTVSQHSKFCRRALLGSCDYSQFLDTIVGTRLFDEIHFMFEQGFQSGSITVSQHGITDCGFQRVGTKCRFQKHPPIIQSEKCDPRPLLHLQIRKISWENTAYSVQV